MSLTDFVLNNNTWFEADCFDITLPNGSLLRATSHQNDLVVGGNTYYATKNGKWERGSTTQECNAVNEMELTLQCDESILFPNSVSTPMFQRAKLFARSTVKVTVTYMDLGEVIQGTQVIFNGVITIPSQESARVTFKCSDYGYLLQQAWPRRVICSGCPFTVFDSNCGLNKASFKVSKTVLSGSTQTSLVVSSISALGNGPEYTLHDNLQRLKSRGLGAKRSLALREFALGLEALERFVHHEPLRRVHECVFGALALESEPVDPRL